MHTSLFAG